MQTIPENIDLILPYGEALRGFMEQSFIAPSDLKHALRARGVFLCREEKRDTIPILSCCLLSPQEFDELRERQATREDNPKTITRTLAWISSRSLLEAIPQDMNLGGLVTRDCTNYKVIGTPCFVPIGNDPNNISCEFEIEREDLSKNWAATKSNFKGKLRIERASNGRAIKLILTNTADETRDLNQKFVQRLNQHFRDNGDVSPNAEIERILFSCFGNEERIAFYRSLTKNLATSGFEFTGATNIGVSPDEKVPLPRELKWMEARVKGLQINGVALQNTFFMQDKDKAYHRFFLFYAMEAKFNFTTPIAKGSCSVVFEFPDFAAKKNQDAEFEVNISSLALAPESSHVSRSSVKEELLRRINDCKLSCFDQHRSKSESPPASAQPSSSAVQMEAVFDWSAT